MLNWIYFRSNVSIGFHPVITPFSTCLTESEKNGFQNIVPFNTRLQSKLDHLFVNCKDIFKARKRARLSTADYNVICASTLTPTTGNIYTVFIPYRQLTKCILF